MKRTYLVLLTFFFLFSISENALAHCDHLDGPVVKDARLAIEQNDITPVLKWIDKEDETELIAVYEKTMRVRQAGGEIQELADRYFFETLVRLHRAGERAPFTGLQPVGTPVAGYVTLSDNALAEGSPDKLIAHLQEALEHSITEKFRETYSGKQLMNESVEAGRQYVHDYVEFVHYVKYIVETIRNGDSSAHAHH
jgi:hypothetical protein